MVILMAAAPLRKRRGAQMKNLCLECEFHGKSQRKERKVRLIPCDKDCYYQQQGYCSLDDISYITSCDGNGCGYFTRTDPYAELTDDRDGL